MYEKALELHTVYKKPNFVLQVTPESVSGITSHLGYVWLCKGSYNYPYSTKLHWKKYHLFVGLHTCNNTDGNKLVIFSTYYGDISMLMVW